LAAGGLADAYGAPAVALAFGAATLLGVGLVALAYRPFTGLDVDSEGRGIVDGCVVSGGARTQPALVGVPATAPPDAAAEIALGELI
jgi:hypothetical protein